MRDQSPVPTADGLVVELDVLAAISSLEAYYAADLPVLHSVVLCLEGQADDRVGRYVALRDALERAFGAIDDESFAYAARALLGSGDRWRSVRARSEDAGRAFTPSVSYDSFRRKGGRNYRENTLRAVADVLIVMHAESEQAGEQREGGEQSQVPAEVGVAESMPPQQSTSPATGGPRRHWLALAVPAVLLGVLLAAFLIFAPGETLALQEVDMTRQCRAQNLDGVVVIAERSAAASGGWVCTVPSTGEQTAPLMDEACTDQYGPNAVSAYRDGWTCDLAQEHLLIPPAASDDGCSYVAGTYDGAAMNLNRYSDRFVQAFAAADLPEGVCPSGPMHFYDELEVGGVTQLVALDGQPYGALLADDPANVVLLTGTLWSAYDALRGLQLYQLGVDALGDRVGYPAGPLREQHGIFRLDLTSRGALVGQTEHGSYVWLPSISLEVWEQTGGPVGCLGMPVSSPRTDLESPIAQQFERATVSLDTSTGQIALSPPDACDPLSG